MNKRLFVLAPLVAGLALVAGCVAQVPTTQAGTPAPNDQINVPGVSIQVSAPGPNPLVNTPDANGRVAGTSLGLWHGIISPVTLVLSFINNGGEIYEVHNDGSEYNLGFLLGVAIVFILLGAVVGSRRR